MSVAVSSKEFVRRVDVLKDDLNNLEEWLDFLAQQDALKIANSSEALEYAHLNVSLAFVATSLIFARLRTEGINTENHPIRNELDRVRLYMKKVNDFVSAEEDKSRRKTFSLDKEAAMRIVKFHTTRLAEDASTNDADVPMREGTAGAVIGEGGKGEPLVLSSDSDSEYSEEGEVAV